ncbi:hypothetical protein EJ03DRAFT_319659 [Teratosphaeria nubilosa]|uniref:Rhodopsin domain-containing protein n=1 Tax=Teratosphaeria nubilosa TaxID=161662 RepID=A0A6G1KXH8_9PEZI|nr:hypothetical protein EJ03DRAFT_319659 [Teratosphaeria nubilosa]
MAPGGHATATAVIVSNIVLTASAVAIVLTRLSYRLVVAHNLGIDDALITIALACSIAQGIASCFEAHYAVGVHTSLVTQEQSILSQKALWISILTYNGTLFTGRLSILFQYRRVFVQKWFRICLYILMVVVGLFGIETVLGSILACIPVSKYWNNSELGHCQPKFTVWYVNGGITIVTDITIAILPLPVLARLKISKQKRTALMIIFAMGGITCLLTGARLYFLWVFSSSKDPFYNNGPIAIWSTAEINTILILACLPTLKGVYSRVIRGSKVGSSKSSPPVGHYKKDIGEIIPIEQYRSDSEMTAVPSSLADDDDEAREQGLGPSTAHLGYRAGEPDKAQGHSLRPTAWKSKSWRDSVPRLGSDLIARLSPMPSASQVTRDSDQTTQDRQPPSRERLVSTRHSGSTLVIEK